MRNIILQLLFNILNIDFFIIIIIIIIINYYSVTITTRDSTII